jgi:hypothetical protein
VGIVPTSVEMARKSKPVPVEKPADWSITGRLVAHLLIKPERFATSSGSQVEVVKVNAIANLLWFPDGISAADRDARNVKAIDLFESTKPAEGIEAMLAAQMVGAHHAAMECLRRAMLPGESFEGRQSGTRARAAANAPLDAANGGARQAPRQGSAEDHGRAGERGAWRSGNRWSCSGCARRRGSGGTPSAVARGSARGSSAFLPTVPTSDKVTR